jgi:hypothetical protein
VPSRLRGSGGEQPFDFGRREKLARLAPDREQLYVIPDTACQLGAFEKPEQTFHFMVDRRRMQTAAEAVDLVGSHVIGGDLIQALRLKERAKRLGERAFPGLAWVGPVAIFPSFARLINSRSR